MGQEKRINQEWSLGRTEARRGFSLGQKVCAAWQLTWGKPVWSWQTLVVLLLMGLAVCAVAAHRWLRGEWLAEDFVADVLVPAYLGFLLPITCLSSGVQVLGGAWEEGWLLWMLLRPVSRITVFALLLLAAIPWTLLVALGGAIVLASIAGTEALRATFSVLGTLTLGTLAYLTLFVFFSVLFHRATLVSIAYVFVVENFIGYMPGLINRASINFYLRSLLVEAGWLSNSPEESFLGVEATSGTVALAVLLVAILAFTVASGIMFARREYGDPTA
ncbi:hypothetical protein HRbin36_02774 [bacterium HR36]|nr:hypothetical protein HRbin36_02774 [bacterium HR36]